MMVITVVVVVVVVVQNALLYHKEQISNIKQTEYGLICDHTQVCM